MERTYLNDRYMRFEARTAAAPKRNSKGAKLTHTPRNLAEMLTMLRGMGYRPEDIVISELEWVSDYGTISYA